MKKIAIIGLGQLGSRHLQALANVSEKFDIELVDVSEASLQSAIGRFREMPAAATFDGTITLFKSIESLSSELDIVIVASNSRERRNIVEQLVARCKVKYLVLEKVLFPAIDDYIKVGQLLEEKQVKCWVNCSRRMMPIYQKVREFLTSGTKTDFEISASAWGMGSNAVHFLDLFTYLSECLELHLNSTLLDEDNPRESNREGYLDFTGTITGHDEKGNFIKMTSHGSGSLPVQVLIQTPYERVILNESSGKAIFTSEKNKWQSKETDFILPFQSELTTTLVDGLLSDGACDLPSFDAATLSHLAFLKALTEFLAKKTGTEKIEKNTECQIT